jgi:hypothetical protein
MATAVVVGLLLWLFGGGMVAAAAESELTRRVAGDEDSWPAGSPRAGFVTVAHPAWRVLTVRLIAHLPLLLALSWGAIRIVTATYRELTVPSDVGVPLVLRVAGAAPDALAVLFVAWLLGEVVGAIAARRVILLGERVPTALGAAIVRLVTKPLRAATFALVPLVPLVFVLVVVGFAGSATWEALRAALSIGSDRLVAIALVLALVALFAGGLLLIGVASAWRASIWTVELGGTYGAMGHGPVAYWNRPAESGTLSDLRPRGVDPDTR